MKTKLKLLRWLMIILLSVVALGVWAQTSETLTQSVCVGNQTYEVVPILGATFVWNITGGISTDYLINGSSNNINVDWNTPGIYVLSVYCYIALSCPSITQSVTVTVVPQPTGPTLNVKTPNLLSVCAGTNVSATFSAGSGGVGCNDVYEYRFDGGSWIAYTSGVNLSTTGHTLVEIHGQRSGCISGSGCTGTPWVTLASWNVTPPYAAIISYAGSPFCNSITTAQSVTRVGTTGGTYSAPVGLTIHAVTGAITPSTSTLGTYIVTYNIAAAGGCPVVNATTLVTITTAPTANISYEDSPFCFSLATPQSVTLTGTTGGIYSSTVGLSINATTGAITPSLSTVGNYIVSYSVAAAGGCSAIIATTSVTITTTPIATIAYTGSPFCTSVTIVQPVTRTGTTGGIYSAPVGLTINASTGAVTPSTSTSGTYLVTYTIAAAGGCSAVTATTSVRIIVTPTISLIRHN